MVRQIIYPSSNKITLNLPDELLGKEVEILAFELEKDDKKLRNSMEKGKHSSIIKGDKEDIYQRKKLDEFYDNFQLDFSNYKFDRNEANER
jgi:hypothetical protein